MSENGTYNWSVIFLEAAKRMDIANMVAAMVMGADVTIKCPETGNTALHFAAYHSSPELYEFVAGPEDRFYRDIPTLVTDSKFNDLMPEADKAVSRWKAAFNNAPLVVQNDLGLLPSSCIPRITLQPKSPIEKIKYDFWFATLSLEYMASQQSPAGFIDILHSNSSGTAFPNIV